MLDYHLFFGFPLNSVYQDTLNKIPSNLRSLFIQNHSDYLQQVEYNGSVYLGKNLGPYIEYNTLDMAEANIYSLLRRLIPDYPYEDSLFLLAIPASTPTPS